MRIALLVVTLLATVSVAVAQTENITVTTYYPSPVGVYKSVRLQPQTTAPVTCNSTNEGAMYYDSSALPHIVRTCTFTAGSTYEWVNTTGAGTCTTVSCGGAATCNCGAGYYQVGGGCSGAAVTSSYPYNGTAWTCAGTVTNTFVRCCK